MFLYKSLLFNSYIFKMGAGIISITACLQTSKQFELNRGENNIKDNSVGVCLSHVLICILSGMEDRKTHHLAIISRTMLRF